MKKKGVTLVEMLIVIALFSIIVTMTYSFIKTNDNINSVMSSYTDRQINTRIAMEYLIDRFMDSQSIKLQEHNSSSSSPHIRVETRMENPTNILIIDGERIYIKKDTLMINGKQRIENILRCDTDSQQVVPGIYAFEIWDKGSGVYLITLYLENPDDHEDPVYPSTHLYNSYVKKRS